MATLYRVRDWAKFFENNRTRELKKLDWLPLPNKMDGDGYTELLDHEDGAAHFGAWCAILEVASKCDPRGVLIRNRTIPQAGATTPVTIPQVAAECHTVASLSRLTRIKATVFNAAIPRLLDIGWIEMVDCNDEFFAELMKIPQGDAEIPQGDAEKCGASRARGVLNLRERKGKEGEPLISFDEFPEIIRTPAFRERWEMFLESRRQLKKKLTPLAAQQTIKKLAAWGHDRAIRALGLSIENGWQGVFDPDERKGTNANGHESAPKMGRSSPGKVFISPAV